ncbi:MAG: hypothetical protein EA340_11275 [Nitriliruptor sp.]|nr:MAG: hypothetical protein EA340_11275 [Nitriliruptor sp.]
MLALTESGVSHSPAAWPGGVSRNRLASIEWHIMSLRTPPPCRLAFQNQLRWGPECSSALRAR